MGIGSGHGIQHVLSSIRNSIDFNPPEDELRMTIDGIGMGMLYLLHFVVYVVFCCISCRVLLYFVVLFVTLAAQCWRIKRMRVPFSSVRESCSLVQSEWEYPWKKQSYSLSYKKKICWFCCAQQIANNSAPFPFFSWRLRAGNHPRTYKRKPRFWDSPLFRLMYSCGITTAEFLTASLSKQRCIVIISPSPTRARHSPQRKKLVSPQQQPRYRCPLCFYSFCERSFKSKGFTRFFGSTSCRIWSSSAGIAGEMNATLFFSIDREQSNLFKNVLFPLVVFTFVLYFFLQAAEARAMSVSEMQSIQQSMTALQQQLLHERSTRNSLEASLNRLSQDLDDEVRS